VIGAGELQRMRRAFFALPERDRAIFASVSVEGLGYAQAAERHGCTVVEVEQTIARVLIVLNRAAAARRE
jgi:DNA-directed RNA polymerase specialized sigma24 family protein